MSIKKVFVLDSTAFYAGVSHLEGYTCYTTKDVLKEVGHKRMVRSIIESLIESGRLKVVDPSPKALKEASYLAEKSGESRKISKADLSLIALGLDLKGKGFEVLMVSDDYSVENLAKLLNIRFSPIMSRGIKKTLRWIWYCKGCGKTFTDGKEIFCDVCGTKLSRRFKKRQRA